MTFLLGRQAMLGHDPPTYRRSTTAERFPCEASVQARSLPAAPLPRTTTSKFSGLGTFTSSCRILPTIRDCSKATGANS